MARLAKAVVVRGRKGHVLFLPGQDVPEWAQKLITNPHAWASDEQDEQSTGEASVPPKSGTGSGRDAWAAYAVANEVDVIDDMSRDDIQAVLEAAGVPTA